MLPFAQIVLLCWMQMALPGSQGAHLTADEYREDLACLYETLQAVHFDLFQNTPRDAFEAEFDRIWDSATESVDVLTVHRELQRFAALARHAHCTLDSPGSLFRQFLRDGGLAFPFELAFEEGRAIVVHSYVAESPIEVGHELLALDGTPMAEVLAEVLELVSGENPYARLATLELVGVMQAYWFARGPFESSIILSRAPDGTEKEVQVHGVDVHTILERQPLNVAPVMRDGREVGSRGEVAYLRPGDFLNLGSGDQFDSSEFLRFLESSFEGAAESRADTLILDLRGNNGGDSTFSNVLLAYIADRPFRFASSYNVRTSQITKSYWEDVDIPELAELKSQILKQADGSVFEWSIPEVEPRGDALRFDGNVFALVDRFSFSNASVVAAVIQDYGFGMLVGEETSYVPSSCGAIHEFRLPNSGIRVSYPKAYSVRPSGDRALRGVRPEHHAPDDPLTEIDETLEHALSLILQRRRSDRNPR